MLYFAKTKLNYTEDEFWKLSLRKYVLLRDEWTEEHIAPKEPEMFADDLF